MFSVTRQAAKPGVRRMTPLPRDLERQRRARWFNMHMNPFSQSQIIKQKYLKTEKCKLFFDFIIDLVCVMVYNTTACGAEVEYVIGVVGRKEMRRTVTVAQSG